MNCAYNWFHSECVNTDEDPRNKWYCPICQISKEWTSQPHEFKEKIKIKWDQDQVGSPTPIQDIRFPSIGRKRKSPIIEPGRKTNDEEEGKYVE